MGNILKILFFLIVVSGYSQQYDFTECSVNITDEHRVRLRQLQGFNNIILLQSGTKLTIDEFSGTTIFVHGFKALEEEPNYVKPVLVIKKCLKGYKFEIGKRIKTKLALSCGGEGQTNNTSIISIFNN